MKSIFTALGPSATGRDCIRAVQLLLSPGRWQEGAARGELEHTIRTHTGFQYATAFESGRTCLAVLLRALNFSRGDEVLVQAYTCVAVPNAVLWAGLLPRYVDVEPATLNMSPDDLVKKITPRAKALIIQHTFGSPAAVERIVETAKKYNLFLIEDCAHSLGATYRGRPVGSFGDAAFFSFGRDKVVSSVFGGVLAVRDEKLFNRISEQTRSFPHAPRAWIVQQLFHPLISTLCRATYTWASAGKLTLALVRMTGFLSRPVQSQEKRGEQPSFAFHRMPNALCNLALFQLKILETINEHRRECARDYTKGLASLAITLPREDEGGRPIYLRYCIQTDKADGLIAFARKRGIFLGDWYRQPIAPEGVAYGSIGYVPGSCPQAELCATQSANLPTDIHISRADRDRIIACVREFFQTP